MKTIVTSQLPVMALEIDEEGTVAQKSMQLTRQGRLDCIRESVSQQSKFRERSSRRWARQGGTGAGEVSRSAGWSIASSALRVPRKTGGITPSTRNSNGNRRTVPAMARGGGDFAVSSHRARCGSKEAGWVLVVDDHALGTS